MQLGSKGSAGDDGVVAGGLGWPPGREDGVALIFEHLARRGRSRDASRFEILDIYIHVCIFLQIVDRRPRERRIGVLRFLVLCLKCVTSRLENLAMFLIYIYNV